MRFLDAHLGRTSVTCFLDTSPFFTQLAEGVDAILDIGAGTGRIALALARDGHDVWCVEPSPTMLAVLKKKRAAQQKLSGACRDPRAGSRISGGRSGATSGGTGGRPQLSCK
ncbi:MAG: class I SAM-dependent methyltransferase [Candidatus Eisenbacteria sp.]|nr:class I SAM-dependent methyltransferase [Candidatus Eisenbacteria bacterium]